MCPNRVQELESRVQELEASVEGLTDELVECKVRLRELENAMDEDLSFVPGQSAETTEEPEAEGDTTKPEATESEDKAEDSQSEIIVA
jgi:chromosome segregation ATPase